MPILCRESRQRLSPTGAVVSWRALNSCAKMTSDLSRGGAGTRACRFETFQKPGASYLNRCRATWRGLQRVRDMKVRASAIQRQNVGYLSVRVRKVVGQDGILRPIGNRPSDACGGRVANPPQETILPHRASAIPLLFRAPDFSLAAPALWPALAKDRPLHFSTL